MKVYKEKQYLIFEREDGKKCIYNFATNESIGFSGKPVKSLTNQLKGMTLNDIFNSCVDPQYGKFLSYIKKRLEYRHRYISNIGSILKHEKEYKRYEQIFSAGVENLVGPNFYYTLSDIPKSLLKISREQGLIIDNDIVEHWKLEPDACYYTCTSSGYLSLTKEDLFTVIQKRARHYINGHWEYTSMLHILINEYGYNTKTFLLYLDELKTYEALTNIFNLLGEIMDYASMMNEISNKFDRYPRNFLTTHRIACRNYDRLKIKFEEEAFKKRINTVYECYYKDYCFIYPKSTQEIKDEAVQQNNCVASYIKKVIDGECDILFLRKKQAPETSLVTLEIRDNKIVQAKRRFNAQVTEQDQEAINYWNKKFEIKERIA